MARLTRGIFKAYDIRGVYPGEIDEDLAGKIGTAFVNLLRARRMVVGRDVRLSSPAMAKAMAEGMAAAGADVLDVGPVTTPMCYFAIGRTKCDGGAMTTASHNPPEYNGFKLCREDAIPLSEDTGILDVHDIIEGGRLSKASRAGRIEKADLLEEYRRHVLSFAGKLGRMKVVVDTANGSVGDILRGMIDELGIDVTPLYFEPDGRFPNHEPNPLKDENLADVSRKVRDVGAVLGVAFDGDGDRCVFVDEKGDRAPADLVTALIAREVLRAEVGVPIVYDLRSSWAVKEDIEAHGGEPVMERVGHSFIKQTMRRVGAVFAGELSGHYYFKGNYFTDAGLIAMVKVLNLLSSEKKAFSELLRPLRRYCATGEMNFRVEDKEGMLEEIAKRFSDGRILRLDGVTVEYDDWWFNVRKSNTEPLVRLNLEARTPELMERGRKRVVELLGSPE